MGHVVEEVVGGQIDVVNNLAQVLVEVGVGQVLQVVQRILGDVTLPLELAWKHSESFSKSIEVLSRLLE